MHYTTSVFKQLRSNEILRFIISFLLIYGGLSLGNYIWAGMTVPGGYYSSWLHRYADYISGLRQVILMGASSFLSMLGYENEGQGYYLHVVGGKTVRMVYSCIGLNIICVWWAFNLAYPQALKKRAIHILAGTI